MTFDVIANLQNAFWAEAERVLYHHTNPWELDEALTLWGFGTGPCEAQDHIGLEKVLLRQKPWPGPILPRMVAEGRLGKIGGVGFYRYPGGGGAVIDPLIEDLILEEAWFGKVERKEMSDAALVAAMMQSILPVAKAFLDLGKTPEELEEALCLALLFPKGKRLFN